MHPYFSKIVSELARVQHLPTVCDILMDYSDRFLEPGSDGQTALDQGIVAALNEVTEPFEIVTLASVLCQLRLGDGPSAEKNVIALAKLICNPIKAALSAHHIEKQAAFEIISALVEAADA